jgi:hypothetical protein
MTTEADLSAPGAPGEKETPPKLKDRLLATFGTISAALGGLALFRAFGPLSDLQAWAHNVLTAYDALVLGPVRMLAHFIMGPFEISEFTINSNIFSVVFIGISLRAILSHDRTALRREFKDLQHAISPAFNFTLGLAVGVVISSQLETFLDRITFVLRYVIFTAPSLAGIIMLIDMTINFINSFDDGPGANEYDPGPAFRKYFYIEAAVVLLVLVGLFVFGTTAFFSFG